MLFKAFFFVLLIFNFFQSNLAAENKINSPICFISENYNKKEDILEIKIHENKKWIENLFNLMIEFNKSEINKEHRNVFTAGFNIDENYKKNFKSKLKIISKKNNTTCEFDANVRLMGDTMWHFEFAKGMPYASMRVKLNNGHIRNKTIFRLLLPISRNKNNEILITTLLRYLGLLAPETFYTKVKINGITKKFIFQEDLQKELLESYSLIEGPILEGDERFTNKKKFFGKNFKELSLSRVSNSKYVKEDSVKINKAIEALTLMNQIYIQSHLSGTNNIELLRINNKFFNRSIFHKSFNVYESLIYALYASHGQSHDDRRFYYDPINNQFLPIYYDGKAKILNNLNIEDKLETLKFEVSKNGKKGAAEASSLINNIDDQEFKNLLEKNGFSLSDKEYFQIKEKIIKRLDLIQNIDLKETDFAINEFYFQKFINKSKNIKLVFSDKNLLSICDLDLNNCKHVKLNNENYIIQKSLIAQNFDKFKKYFTEIENDVYLFIGKKKNYIKELKLNNFQTKKINNFFSISYNNKIELQIDYINKIITLKQNHSRGRAILKGKKIENWRIDFIGRDDNENDVQKNFMNLTGCLTLIDLKIKDLILNALNSKCEDAINIIRSEGDIKEVNIENSASDALDLDFSSIKILNVNIDNSKNDCLDVSFGKYKFINTNLNKCGDKGISIGEKSTAELKKVKIKNVETGISTKDSSLSTIDKLEVTNSNFCISAYRKKQEFGGSKMKIKDFKCDNYNKRIYKDEFSNILIEQQKI